MVADSDYHGIVSAPQPIAVEEAAKVLRGGGNAIDAAVTAAFVQGVIDPTNCGLGVGACCTSGQRGKRRPMCLSSTASYRRVCPPISL